MLLGTLKRRNPSKPARRPPVLPPPPMAVQEHIVYPEAVAALVDGRITWREDGVPILWSAH